MNESPFNQLSPRQRDCLRLVFAHQTTKEIAAELGISPGTVDSYIAEAVAALGAPNRRVAAQRLNAFETQEDRGAQSSGVAPRVNLDVSTPTSPPASSWGPLDFRNRDSDNENGILARIGWVILLAFVIAVGSLVVVSAVRSVNDLYRERSAR